MMLLIDHLIKWQIIVNGARKICRIGWDMAAFEYRQAQEIRDALARHIDDIIASKAATNRVKDRESLPRLRSFREYWEQRQTEGGAMTHPT